MLKTPPLQTATATIDTLCGRLQSATLLEDRRAAILGLRSFAKQYPASVASGSLRELISTLRRDGLGEPGPTRNGRRSGEEDRDGGDGAGDIDTIRLILETLIMLFNPDSSSPEASDEIAFFMADEFSMRQDNISLLLTLLDPTSPYADYYSRFYSVQLLSAICAARPERLRESILSAPLGISRLVGVLDDGRDAVRNAGLLLLVDLTGGANEDLRKIVAFEDVFGKIFALIRLEGGLAEAGIAAQDCLSLLANLIRGSGSNQTMFRESGCVAQLTQLLTQAFPPPEAEAAYLVEGREKASWGLLQLLQLFLVAGEASTPHNQAALFRAGTAQVLLDLAFHPDLPLPIRVSALRATAALISGNAPLQEAFAALQVLTPSASSPNPLPPPATSMQTNGSRSKPSSGKSSARPSRDEQRTYIIEALLDLTLAHNSSLSALRAAGCAVIQAYLRGHERIKAHFLQRAIAGHTDHETAANVLNTLLSPPSDQDMAGVVFAGWIVQDLISSSPKAKAALASIREGEAEEGEDELTCIQLFGSLLLSVLQRGAGRDDRLVVSYASLLITLLWDFADGVNDLLSEGSALLQALVDAAKNSTGDIVAGLAAGLLGTVYEFSTKDSPIPRRMLAPLLTGKLGRVRYLSALMNLRRHRSIRDFGLEDSEEALLSEAFVDLFLLEFGRLRKAIDKDPGVEVLPASAVEAGVDRDVLDALRQEAQSAKDTLSAAQSEALASAQRAEQELMAAKREAQSATAEVDRLRRINQAMQSAHVEESAKTLSEHELRVEGLNVEHARAMAGLRQEAEGMRRAAVRESEEGSRERVAEFEKRLAELGNAHRAEQAGHQEARERGESLRGQFQQASTRARELGVELEALQAQHADLQRAHQQMHGSHSSVQSALDRARQLLDDRNEAFAALEAQVSDLKDELKAREEELAAERKGFAELDAELEAAKTTVEALEMDAQSARSASPPAVDDGTAKERLVALAKELADTRKKLLAAETALAAATANGTESAEERVKAAQAAEKAAKEELEGMLLVLADIEAKRDQYREKVRELGGEVSEEDVEDEGDEDEGSDEEGEGERV